LVFAEALKVGVFPGEQVPVDEALPLMEASLVGRQNAVWPAVG